ncbi:sugar ABC transporter permease [Oceanotoga sp. DSM 15011]|uniref:carbohydrate ABC transporter permease n=1 Tax=Oceanotoga sp. DSM 15011 TaxID=2984951 RepID=UPI0021F412A8|nr:sugar ABC transporter permease [Oceanotoga sp. DSM 15011]UYO99094.1 sugar ABC transporter permease [Oceanotoga sp. DSM 15011]
MLKKSHTQKNKFLIYILIPAFLFLGLFIYFPVIKGIFISFKNYTLFDLSNTQFNNFQNFKNIFTDQNFRFIQILFNTIIWVVISLLFQFILGFILALLMKKPFKGRGLYSALVFYPWALSGFAIGLIWAWMFNGQFGVINDILLKLGLINSNIGFLSNPKIAMISVIVVNIWYGVPFFAIMLLAALQSVPNELYEAAKIDGAGPVKQLFSITIPYIKPTIISTTLLRTIWIMNFPDIIYAMTNGGPANSTNILATQMINKILKFYDYGQGSAYGVVIIVILLTYAIIYLKISSKKGNDNI